MHHDPGGRLLKGYVMIKIVLYALGGLLVLTVSGCAYFITHCTDLGCRGF